MLVIVLACAFSCMYALAIRPVNGDGMKTNRLRRTAAFFLRSLAFTDCQESAQAELLVTTSAELAALPPLE